MMNEITLLIIANSWFVQRMEAAVTKDKKQPINCISRIRAPIDAPLTTSTIIIHRKHSVNDIYILDILILLRVLFRMD